MWNLNVEHLTLKHGEDGICYPVEQSILRTCYFHGPILNGHPKPDFIKSLETRNFNFPLSLFYTHYFYTFPISDGQKATEFVQRDTLCYKSLINIISDHLIHFIVELTQGLIFKKSINFHETPSEIKHFPGSNKRCDRHA